MSKVDPDGKSVAVVKKDAEDADSGQRSWAAWVTGWVLLPGTVIGGIWVGGVLVGVHFHDSWFTRAVVWTVDLF